MPSYYKCSLKSFKLCGTSQCCSIIIGCAIDKIVKPMSKATLHKGGNETYTKN